MIQSDFKLFKSNIVSFMNRFSEHRRKGGLLGRGILYLLVHLFVNTQEYLQGQRILTMYLRIIISLTLTVCKQLGASVDERYHAKFLTRTIIHGNKI